MRLNQSVRSSIDQETAFAQLTGRSRDPTNLDDSCRGALVRRRCPEWVIFHQVDSKDGQHESVGGCTP